MTDQLLFRCNSVITYWVANVGTAWRRHRLAVLWAVSAAGKLLRLLHAGLTVMLPSVSRYLKHTTMDLLRLQARANGEYAIEVAAWSLGESLTNRT